MSIITLRKLWFAWKIVLLQYHKQHYNTEESVRLVVICLKNRTFAVSQTASVRNSLLTHVLWFAWKIVLLQYHKQPPLANFAFDRGCDLLEKSYFCSITNSIFGSFNISVRLWFAWKIVLLQYHKQPQCLIYAARDSCDLLEKSYFCSITNSLKLLTFLSNVVVICLKNRTFAVSQTAVVALFILNFGLWFAWKIVLLQYHKQPLTWSWHWQCRCDLLEKSYFCSITNSL